MAPAGRRCTPEALHCQSRHRAAAANIAAGPVAEMCVGAGKLWEGSPDCVMMTRPGDIPEVVVADILELAAVGTLEMAVEDTPVAAGDTPVAARSPDGAVGHTPVKDTAQAEGLELQLSAVQPRSHPIHECNGLRNGAQSQTAA